MTGAPTEDAIVRKLRRYSRLIGDDCAVLQLRPDQDLLVTTDFTIEGVHFKRGAKPEEVGHRALARGLSDIAAMGGRPEYFFISLAMAPWTSEDWIDGFYRGLMTLARKTRTRLAGGDLSHARQLVCDVIVHGSVAPGAALLRSGAKPGDTIYVSGRLGGWKHKPVIQPRLDAGLQLIGRAHACMDISDGLALDLHRLCLESSVAAELDNVPLLPGARLDQALYDGEDYELLYTAPSDVKVPGIAIGTIVKGKPGAVTYSGRKLEPKGYDHTQHRT